MADGHSPASMSQRAAEGAGVRLRPVTAKERAVWLLHQYLPGEGALNQSFAVEPVAELDLAALRAAAGAVIRRHENLRTLFPAVDGEPRRLTLPTDDPRLEQVVTVREVRPAELDEESSREMSAGFDLTAELPIRVSVLRCGGSDMICVTVSHIVYDGVSHLILRAEFEEVYAALRSGGRLPASLASQVPAPALCDPDEQTLAYWRGLLAGVRPSRDLDIGRPRAREAGYPGTAVWQPIRPEVWEAIRTIARRTSSPVSAVLLAGLATVLSRHGAGNDIVIGVPTQNRGAPRHRAIGFYACIAAVRVRLDPDADFGVLVRQCARQLLRQMLEGLEHVGANVDDVVPGAFEASGPGDRPLVRYLMNYMTGLTAQPDRGTVLRDCPPPRRTHSRMDLDLAVQETLEGPDFRAVYASDLFSTAEIDRLLSRLQAVLAAAADGGSVGAIDMRTEADREAMRSPPAAEPLRPPLLAEEIATSAFTDPGAAALLPAVAWPGLGYGELGASAAALAVELAEREVVAGERVGVLAGSLADTAIGVLGCWAAGGAAVLLSRASDGQDLRVTAAAEGAATGAVPIRRETGQAGTACFPSLDYPALIVSYGGTSVVLSHGALAVAAAALAAELPLTSGDLVAVDPSARYGPQFLEVLLALAAGARVLPMTAADEAAARHALDQGASVLVTSPEVAGALLSGSHADGRAGNVRMVLRGGRLLPGLAGRARAAGISLLRVTGPVGSAGVVLAGALPDEAGPGLLGRMPSLPRLRLTDRSGAPALPLTWARLLDREGVDVLGVPVREAADGWLETIDDGMDGTRDEVTDPAGSQAQGIAEALGVDFVALWRTILNRPEAGAEGNFFALGGDSLRAARLVAQVHKRTGVKISLREVFKAPTPVSFAAAVQAAFAASHGPEPVGFHNEA
jgi:non-ribosomal peptide synthetase component F/acyl carrier protein